MARLRTSPAARADLHEIRRYSRASFGTIVASEYLGGLSAAFDRIAARPLVGAAVERLAPDMRSLSYRSHRIYYRVDGDAVLVVRILHHARDAPSTLEPET